MMKNFLLGLSALFLAFVPSGLAHTAPSSITFSPLLYPGPVDVQFTSGPSAADGPRVFPINATTFDWWYFDAVSDDGTQAVTIIFFTSSYIGFSFNPTSAIDPLNIYVFANFPNGTSTSFPVPATSVTITTDGNGATGEWTGTGIGFQGAADLSTYNVTFDNALLGLSGSISLASRGPGHYYCGPLEAGLDEQVLSNIGWANVMPAADAVVDLTLSGQPLKFNGNGYHDKNWGDTPFTSALQSWYWGHATFGDYNIVFFDMVDAAGEEKVGGYALLDGEVIGSTCTTGMVIRPVGTPYPPTQSTALPTQLTINMTLNDGSTLSAVVTKVATQVDIKLYTRWIGTIKGTVHGVTQSGSSVWEQFAVNP